MEICPDKKEIELLTVVVNFGMGSKVISIAKKNNIMGATVFLGKGTAKSRVLEILDLSDVRKEIVLMIADRKTADDGMRAIGKELHFKKPNHGIAFITPVSTLLGTRFCKYNVEKERKEGGDIVHNAIFAVVDKGNAESVIEAAVKAGSKGGTIINARGSGVHETNKVFSMAIEPEKEIVMILSETQLTDSIVCSIEKYLQLDQPGNGIVFVLDVTRACGLY